MRKKRILLIGLGNVYGGIEVYLLRLIALLQSDAEIYILATHPVFAEQLSSLPVVLIRFPRIVGRWRGLRWVLAMVFVTYYVIRYRIDIVQVNGFSEILMLLPARLLLRRAVATCHISLSIDLRNWYKDAQAAAFLIYRRFVALAHTVICVSDSAAKYVKESLPESRIVTIPNWAPQILPFQDRPMAANGIVHLLFVGRLEKRKGLAILLQALETLDGMELTVVGDGEDRSILEEMACQMPVKFVGHQADPSPYYEKADIFVMPSIGPEGMPLVTLEAMSRSLPCILSNLDVHEEISGNGRAALLFSNGDAADLRKQIRLLSRDAAIRSSIARSGYDSIKTNHHPEIARAAYLQAFGLLETNSTLTQKSEAVCR